MHSDKVTTIAKLLKSGFKAPTLTQAVKMFTNAYWLNKAYEKEDETLILEQMSKALMKLTVQPDLANMTKDEIDSLYPQKDINLEVLSPADLAVKQLKRETLG